VKPFYYRLLPSGVIFGSEIKAILAADRVSRRINPAALHEYLYYGNALGLNTFYDGIRKLLPGHYLTLSRSQCKAQPYWTVGDVGAIHASPADAEATLRDLVEQAVRSQLVSDVPVGVFLSGGIDSSCITAFASKHYKGRLKTFSVGFDFDDGVNELPKARLVAEYFDTEHHEIHIAGTKLNDVIESLVCCHDEPFADAANIPLFLLCKQLAGSPKVILQGDGGDEIFGGYRRYNVLTALHFWRYLAPVGLWATGFPIPMVDKHRLARFCSALLADDEAMRMALLLTKETQAEPPTRILSREWRQFLADLDPFARYRTLNQRFNNLDPVQRMLYTDASVLLPDTFLEKVDKASMAHSIEVRVPLLDEQLTTYVMGLPASFKVRWGRKKWLLRRVLQGILPDEILNAPKKGFGVPYSHWLRKPLAGYLRSILLDSTVRTRKMFDERVLAGCIKEHIDGSRDHGFLLWKALHLALWCHIYRIEGLAVHERDVLC
jgi:asparagine synthase (glutamine-hydrolysing)